MTEELKPCPFCGGKARMEKKWNGNHPIIKKDDFQYFAFCEQCASEGPWKKTENNAIQSWNTRPLEDALRAEVERLRAALEAIANADVDDYDIDGRPNYRGMNNPCEYAREALEAKP